MSFETNPKKLKEELLNSIHTRETALPDFQRDFVWQPSQTKGLILSLAQNFPAGSLLRIESSDEMFHARAFAGAPGLNGHHPKYLILDGQQRLTSLYQALYGTGDHQYFVNLRRLAENRDLEDALFYERRERAVRLYGTLAVQAEKRVLPLSVIFGGDGFHNWLDKVEEYLEEHNAQSKLAGPERRLTRQIYEDYLEPIVKYEFPVVTLPESTPLEAVCTIFETLNSTGVRLSVFDLLAARFFVAEHNLRQMWAEAVEKSRFIERFEIDPYYLLQIITSRTRNSVKRSEVLKLNPEDVMTHWESAVWALEEALTLLHDECGVLKKELLPYNTIVIPLTSMFMSNRDLRGPILGDFRSKVRRWYWCSVFGQSYESNPTSQTITDINEFNRWLEGGSEPTSVSEFEFEKERLYTATPRQRAIYRGILGLILRTGPRDFHSTKPITAGVMEESNVNDHHIFPNAYLNETTSLAQNEIDAIVNRTLIDRETNQRIGKNPPSRYLSQISGLWQQTMMLNEVLKTHFLPTGEHSSLYRDDYESFRQERACMLHQLIEQATASG